MKALLLAVSLASAPALAEEAAPAEAAASKASASPAPAPGRFFAHLNLGINAYTYVAPTAAAPGLDMTPASRAMLFQQVGGGYWVHPLVRLQLTLMFGETVSGLPAGGSAFTLAAAMPLVVLTWKGAFIGTGPLIAPRALGTWALHAGVFTFFGYALPLGAGFSLGLAVQVPVMFAQRVSVAVTPALTVGYRF